ncbi:uncharacterized protein LOC125005378 [Tachysurus ichikawai]
MDGVWLSFVIRATYNLLPSPQNLKEWYGEDPACSLCQVPASLRPKLAGSHQGYRGYGIEGDVPGRLGKPLSLLETLWALINETAKRQGANTMTPMTYLTILFHHSTPTASIKRVSY